MNSIAIITPWFGKELKGGAEQQAWQVATRLAQRGHEIEVLTTCCQSFADDWSVNHLRPGLTQELGIKIRRFPVNPRNSTRFDVVNSAMLSLPSSHLRTGVSPVVLEDADVFAQENINSTALLNFLSKHQNNYQAFIFIPYLYGVILNGLPLVSNQAFLQPCLHDEVYAYLPQVAEIFHAAKGLLFISEGEAELAKQLYGAGIIPKSIVTGAGIELERHDNTATIEIKNFSPQQEKYILSLGRRDVTKNTDLLVRAYSDFKQKHLDSHLKLVIVGPGNPSFLKPMEGLVDLGLVKENQKATLLANCLALFQPSHNESYSRVIMEAWFYCKPVAAHSNCLATAMAVKSAKGGLLAATEIEWSELFAEFDKLDKETITTYGTNGQKYTQENAVWDRVIERYELALGLCPQSPPIINNLSSGKLKEIHQLLPNLAYGDAISNHALAIRDYLRKCGYESNIFVRYLDDRVAQEAKLFQPHAISQKAGLIYHHSIGSELTDYAIAHRNVKCLIYHNITPAEFFLPYRPDFAQILRKGRGELPQLAEYFPLSLGDSGYNARELLASGFTNPGVLPIAVDPSKWDMAADVGLMEHLQDGKTNLLFVGRLAPNKCQDDLLTAFDHYLTMDQQARLILVGKGDPKDPYYRHLLDTIDKLRLREFVMLPGQVNDAQLLAFYRTAHLFWSMSEHEGFCVPLVEAMWFDIPILAYASTAVPETLAEGGILFTTKEDLIAVAALAKILVGDGGLRAKVINAQRRRINDFSLDNVHQKISEMVLRMSDM
ncbi:glycosyltransferase family 4 protein [Umezakia ovalisporum]|jgi:glycosyltransferase involved in cell wall biosynthesis|uniref:glycosyltransferase family 4 protein n=1 Tax=Umezakia ovalisporum TaxID=75695 RepID=UPI000B30F84E|nr:glycosyltransferase family 4 protein [Umezakia ovalisporum]MDH6102764.1 glycosyltransferase family 4 protein [Umezakia ovalisporum ANA283AFssAo]